MAFNRTIAEFGLDVEWGEGGYPHLLQVGVGRRRLRHHVQVRGFDNRSRIPTG